MTIPQFLILRGVGFSRMEGGGIHNACIVYFTQWKCVCVGGGVSQTEGQTASENLRYSHTGAKYCYVNVLAK